VDEKDAVIGDGENGKREKINKWRAGEGETLKKGKWWELGGLGNLHSAMRRSLATGRAGKRAL
jgi:hypothetical protein